ncbi:tyrosine-type recombinase/integrase [Maridesulfovibrio bastinii]|uniref:tyrosine-type recombinase/integrase n=1 Tax=Maridesulfovibrio bastinii TaxID=47157 RepID=UPI000415FB84|nr:site-specific integrase [Maridesulfovibrio bastinii]
MAKTTWSKTKFPGVRYREHETRKHGIQPDKYYTITYKHNGKTKTEAVGWASNGVKPQDAANLLGELKSNHAQGKFPQTLKQKKEMAEAQLKEERLLEEARHRAEISFDEIWKRFYEPQAKTNKSEKSWKREESLYRLWISPAIGKIPFVAVSPTDLEQIKQSMSQKDRSPRSIQYALATVRQVYNIAKNLDIFSGDNPVQKTKIPKTDNRRIRFLSEDEASQLLDELRTYESNIHLIALVSLYCGLRAGEILNLEWRDIDFDNDMILIRESKSGLARHAFMTKQVKRELEGLRKSSPKSAQIVFGGKDGNRRYEIPRAFSKSVTKLKFNEDHSDRRQKVVFHTLRHTFASWLVQRGTPLYTVAKLMGHSTLAMTERYAHLAPDNLKAAVAVLDD